MNFAIRPITDGDDIEAITRLVRSAYAPHAANGLKFFGTYQTPDDTRKRLAQGTGLIALHDEQIVGTIVARPPMPESPCVTFREPNTWSFGQFAVDPARKGHGVGHALHDAAVALAVQSGANHMALDTAKPALGLIALYERWGYAIVGEQDWRPTTNYLSVVMRKGLVK